MGSVNISIKEDAYRFLKSMKRREDESFSEVILELKEKTGKRGLTGRELLQFAGALKDKNIDWEAKEKRMREFRKSFNKRVEETRKYMEKARKERVK